MLQWNGQAPSRASVDLYTLKQILTVRCAGTKTPRPTLLKCRLRAECHALCSLTSEKNSLIGKQAVMLKHSFEGWMQGSHAPHTWVLRRKSTTKGGSNGKCVPDGGFPSMHSTGREHSPRRARCPVAQTAPSPVVEVARRDTF